MQDGVNLYGKTEDGSLRITNRKILEEWLKTLPNGEDIVCKFRVQKNYKSTRQVRLCYHCLREIAAKTGHTLEEIKLYLKYKSGHCFDQKIEGEHIQTCKSIADMSKTEMSDFILFMDQWAISNLAHPLLTNDDLNFLKNEI